MKTDGGWINISECARLYGKDRKWVYDQIKKYQIETRKENNRKWLRLVDIIAHRGEPPNGAPTHGENHTKNSHKITPDPTPETELLKQENQFLQKRINALEVDQRERQAREADWQVERARLQGIIERQTYALPKPDDRGVLARFVQWFAR